MGMGQPATHATLIGDSSTGGCVSTVVHLLHELLLVSVITCRLRSTTGHDTAIYID